MSGMQKLGVNRGRVFTQRGHISKRQQLIFTVTPEMDVCQTKTERKASPYYYVGMLISQIAVSPALEAMLLNCLLSRQVGSWKCDAGLCV